MPNLQTAQDAYAEIGQTRYVATPFWPRLLDGDPNANLPTRNPIGANGGLRYVVHIVEGPQSRNPGRIRTLRFDLSSSVPEWLDLHWDVGRSTADRGVRKRLKFATINPDRWLEGTRFLLELYSTDEDETIRREGWAKWEQFQHALAQNEIDPTSNALGRAVDVKPFPSSWLPSKVREWQDIAKEPPVFEIEERT